MLRFVPRSGMNGSDPRALFHFRAERQDVRDTDGRIDRVRWLFPAATEFNDNHAKIARGAGGEEPEGVSAPSQNLSRSGSGSDIGRELSRGSAGGGWLLGRAAGAGAGGATDVGATRGSASGSTSSSSSEATPSQLA